MSVSHASASNVVPLLARIVLGGAFITAGYGKVFSQKTFTGKQAETIRVIEAGEPGGDETVAAGAWTITHASWQDPAGGGQGGPGQEGAQDEGDGADQDAGEQDQDQDQAGETAPDEPDQQQARPQPEGAGAEATGEPVTRRGLYGVAVILANQDMQFLADYAVPLAWLAALTELIGGVLILVGLFSRLWGLGLAVVMVTAFYTTSLPNLMDPGYREWVSASSANYNMLYNQLALFVLAFGVMLTGAGAVSLDRLLFKSDRHGEGHELEHD